MNCETLLCYLPHVITIFLCLAIIAAGIDNVKLTIKDKKGLKFVKYGIFLVCGFQILTVVVFLVNQTHWVINNQDLVVGPEVATSWLIYNYLDHLFHITIAVLINIVQRTHIMYNCRLFKEYFGCNSLDGIDFLEKQK